MVFKPLHWLLPAAAMVACGLVSTPASAGIPECNGMRLEDAFSCELKGSVDCEAGCSDLGVYKKACATELHTVCRDTCTFEADPTCTDSCAEQCSSDCEVGINVICIHNCFDECAGSCSASCEGAEDPETCMASCEATCDGECDIQCEATVDSSCYQHCVECCGGSCSAQANMVCQTDCQEQAFESCEYELAADCDASCDVDGALFCDGEFVMAGPELQTCLDALIDIGVMETVDAINEALDDVTVETSATGCSAGQRHLGGALGAVLGLGLLGLGRRRRR